MDLIALVLDGDTIAIQRLSWQRLATIAPPIPPQGTDASSRQASVISALSWSPTGSSIAVAAKDGSVRLLRVDPSAATAKSSRASTTSTPSSSQSVISCPATAVAWIPYSHAPPAAYLDRDSAAIDSTSTGPSQTLIAVGDSEGCVTFFSFDLAFRVARVQVLPRQMPISKLFFPPGTSSAVVAGVNNISVSLSHLPLRPLTIAQTQVHRAGLESVAVSAIVGELRAVSKTLSDAWIRDGVSKIASTIVGPLQELICDFAETTGAGPWRVLYDAFCGGGVSGALEHLLGRMIGEAGAREALRAFNVAAGEARSAIRVALPLAERMVFRASEYAGLARDTARFATIGVSVADVYVVLEEAQKTLDLLGTLALHIEDSDAEIQAFLRWICSAATHVAGGDPESHQSPEQRDPVEERALVAAYFQSKLEEEVGQDEISALCEEFRTSTVPNLAAAAENLLELPVTAMTKGLQEGHRVDSPSCVSIPLQGAASHPCGMSIVFRKGRSGRSYAEAAFLTSSRRIAFTRHDLLLDKDYMTASPEENVSVSSIAWSLSFVDVEALPGSLLALSHSCVEDVLLFVTKSDPGDGDKCSLFLKGHALPELSFSPYTSESITALQPTETKQVYSVEFCTADVAANCALSVEADRSLANVLVGSRRVVIFDLRGPPGAKVDSGT